MDTGLMECKRRVRQVGTQKRVWAVSHERANSGWAPNSDGVNSALVRRRGPKSGGRLTAHTLAVMPGHFGRR
jgi:hypothetical protein